MKNLLLVIFLLSVLKAFTQTTNFKLNCPDDMVVATMPGKCGSIVNYYAPKITGATGISVTQTRGLAPGSFFAAGLTANVYKATDVKGNSNVCTFNVKVEDHEKPVIHCPTDSVIVLKAGQTGISYRYAEPTVTDNCHVKSLQLIQGAPSGSFFGVGTNKITYRAEDDAGNSVPASFYFTVKQENTPVKTVPVIMVKPTDDKKLPTKLTVTTTGFNDSIDYQHPIEAPELPGCKFTIFVFDNENEDGDTVSIIFNGKVIIDRQMIHVINNYSYSKAMKAVLELDPGKKNVLVSKAWNVGANPPNTCEVDIYEGEITNNMIDANKDKLIKRLILNAVPGVAAGITLQCRK